MPRITNKSAADYRSGLYFWEPLTIANGSQPVKGSVNSNIVFSKCVESRWNARARYY
jgi:hypothetical protein